MSSSEAIGFRWLRTGDDALAAMLAAISAARSSLKLEMYIFSSGPLGQNFRDELVRAARRGVRVQTLIDGVGSDALADSLVDGLLTASRPVIRVSASDFLRPAGERYEHGREDASSFRDRWLDVAALRREVLDAAVAGRVLPALWDAARDRSARAAPVDVAERGVVLVDGLFLLGLGLPAELVVYVSVSSAALLRRGIPEWQLPAFSSYDEEVQPVDISDVLVRAEDVRRPAVLFR
jgi:hypothetical protein